MLAVLQEFHGLRCKHPTVTMILLPKPKTQTYPFADRTHRIEDRNFSDPSKKVVKEYPLWKIRYRGYEGSNIVRQTSGHGSGKGPNIPPCTSDWTVDTVSIR